MSHSILRPNGLLKTDHYKITKRHLTKTIRPYLKDRYESPKTLNTRPLLLTQNRIVSPVHPTVMIIPIESKSICHDFR